MAFYASWIVLCVTISFVQAIPGLIDLGQALADRSNPVCTGPFRIEAEIGELANPRGTTKGWMPCDFLGGKCDPKVTGVIDYETPNNDFGKDSVPYSRFSTLYEGSFEKLIPINKMMTKDVCGTHSTRKVNVRIRAVDKDILSDDTIDRWSCFISTKDGCPADNEKASQWSETKTCSGHNSAHKITWRYRWYRIPDNQCSEKDGSSGILRRIIPFLG